MVFCYELTRSTVSDWLELISIVSGKIVTDKPLEGPSLETNYICTHPNMHGDLYGPVKDGC